MSTKTLLEKTGFRTLDEMLGGGIPLGNVVLLRGAPGSGKTTMALHMMANFLKDPEASGVYFALEFEPDTAINHAATFVPCQNLPLAKDKQLKSISREEMRTAWRAAWSKTHIEHNRTKDQGNNPDKDRKKDQDKSKEMNDSLPLANWLETAFRDCVRNAVKDTGKDKKTLLVIDSLNFLGNMITSLDADEGRDVPRIELRAAMRYICEAVRALPNRKNTMIIFLGEYHPGETTPGDLESESFYCDVEILLTPEPVAGSSRSELDCVNPLGYVMERNVPETGKAAEGKPQATEVRSFCRVLKSRYTRSQSRRCTYDIVANEGVVFYPTYPGDGAMLLFGENDPQSKFWDEFVFDEVPYTYPALRYERFGRTALQRVFATQRQWRYIPARTDLYVASFDSYWIKCYTELYERGLINDLMRRELGDFIDLVTPSLHAALLHKVHEFVDTEDDVPEDVGQQYRDVLIDRLMGGIHEVLVSHGNVEDQFKRDDYSIFPEMGTEWKRLIEVIQSQLDRSSQGEDVQLKECATRILKKILYGKEGRAHEVFKNEAEFNGKVKELFDAACRELRSAQGRSGILHPINRDQLRLYGEKQSKLIKAVDRSHRTLTDAREDTSKRRCSGLYQSVPYNANVSFLVYRPEMLGKREDLYWKSVRAFYDAEQAALSEYQAAAKISPADCIPLPASPVVDQIIEHLSRQEGNLAPRTWEELAMLVSKDKRFLIETQSFDTFICALLEVFWAYGGRLAVSKGYDIGDRIYKNDPKRYKRALVKVKQYLFQSFYLFKYFFGEQIIPPNSTLDSATFGKLYSWNEEENKGPATDWAFARHWYSTFVEVLTTKTWASDGGSWDWLWRAKPEMELGIMQIPTTIQKCRIKRGKLRCSHHSSWGDWHLGVLRSSENVELGVAILNNLMSSNKICEAAFRCAVLPAADEFYRQYGRAKCFNLPERLNEIVLPNITFGEFRNEYMKKAMSRSNRIFDYRHCTREIHSALLNIYSNPAMTNTDLRLIIDDTIDRIQKLKYEAFLLH